MDKATRIDRPLTFALITCSDTRDLIQDSAGAALASLIEDRGWVVARHVVVVDDRLEIAQAITDATDELGVDIVLTCGGTGMSLRDVTPEATRDVCEREVPGLAEGMRAYSMQFTSRAMLSRGVCMQRGKTLVINIPGSEKAARENWRAIVDVLEHAIQMTAGAGH